MDGDYLLEALLPRSNYNAPIWGWRPNIIKEKNKFTP